MQHHSMRWVGALAAFVFLALPSFVLEAQTATTETLVIFRHGEKPLQGLGQLTCQGFNRSLALPPVLATKFGSPDYLFAPNPGEKVDDQGGKFSYVRPLATIEPTAIGLGKSVDAQIGFTQIAELQVKLLEPKYASAKVFIAWEHGYAEKFAKKLLKDFGGDPGQVPSWSNSDYDTIYVIQLTQTGGKTSITFSLDHEGLNGLSTQCPTVH
jgi:hypothetical protein